ncbi:MAG: GNAT family N-acetyltransferase [Chloroflexota bacterium]
MAQPTLTIHGDKIALGPLRRDLVSLYQGWLNDVEVATTYFNGSFVPETAEAAAGRYQSLTAAEDCRPFTIYERAAARPIGITMLVRIDPVNRVAEYGILIGEKDSWGKGYGTETTRLMLELAFTTLDLHNVVLRVFSMNQRAIRAYTRAGFKLIGRQRQAKRVGDRVYDVVYLDCLATEFRLTSS